MANHKLGQPHTHDCLTICVLRCFEDTSNQHQFTYELCFYDHATQKGSYSNPGSANLGSWRGFFSSSPDPNDTSFMAVLDGGDACSNVSACKGWA